MSDTTDPTPENETGVEETPKKEGLNPLWIVGALAILMLVLLGGMWALGSGPTGSDAVAKAPVVEAPATPGESPVATTITPGPITVAVNDDVRLAPVTIKRQDFLCAIVTFDKDVIEGVDLTWPNKSFKERWEICGADLKKEGRDDHGAWSLTVGGKRIKLSEVIVTTGDYTDLSSTPGAIARCWGEGQVNGDGLPACTPQPAAAVAQNAAK